MSAVTVVGGGLAGCEAALALARRGHEVVLLEMRPETTTPAHQTGGLAELVCTNSFKSENPSTAHGQLKREMALLGSVLLEAANESRVPAGSALAVDRRLFSESMERRIAGRDDITIVRKEMPSLPGGPAVVATGPLTSPALAQDIAEEIGHGGLAFYDAIAPIVHGDSIDREAVFAAGRWQEESDYLNCPMDANRYGRFVDALRTAEVRPGPDWDKVPYFEGCLPIEVLAARGLDTPRFGPMKPVGLRDPRTRARPHAVVQLRREDRAGQMWNLVGFQTRLRTGEQRRVFGAIPGLEEAEFLRWGSIHRNSYLNYPGCLTPHGTSRRRGDLFFAGQLTGVEGYTESAASGLLAGINLDRLLRGERPVVPPPETMMGGLCRYLRDAGPNGFQPMNSNWGLVDPMPSARGGKAARRAALADRALRRFREWAAANRCLALDAPE